ncbi:MAG: hypothetical protein HUU57_13970 [Bdellovibrio sp.]|nr:hypothetical protein [Bdellovibrio sp.]
MKHIVSFFVLFAGLTAQAQNFTPEQSTIVQAAIVESCGYMRNLNQVSQTVETIKVDQGVHDLYYTTVLTGERRLDQSFFDAYIITVQSSLTAGYDHQTKTWGVFSVQNVSCVPQ